MPETITHIEDEVRSDPGEENRFSKEKKADTKAKDKEQNKKEQGTKGSKEKKLSFRDAKEITRVGFNLLEGHNLVVSKDELRYFGELLKKHGHNPGEVDRMVAQGDPKILEIAFNILREADVDEAEGNDWLYSKGSANRQREEEFVRAQMQKVKNLADEVLTLDQIRKMVVIDEFKKFDIEAKGGPGTAEAGDEDAGETVPGAADDVRKMLSRMVELASTGRNKTSDEEWNQLNASFAQKIEEFNADVAQKRFLHAFQFVEAIDEVSELTPADKTDHLNAVLSQDQRKEFERNRDDLDEEFQKEYDKMTDKRRIILFKDLELAIGVEQQGLLSGWRRPEEARGNIFGGHDVPTEVERRYHFGGGIVKRGVSKEKALGVEGIREWRATKQLYGVEERVGGELLRRAPSQWGEVPQHLSNIYRLIESTDFSVEDLGHEIQNAYAMLDSIQATHPERRDLRDKLGKELEAFRAFHSFRVSMEREDMDPTRMMDLFKQYFDDETWANFVARFGRDERDRGFLTHLLFTTDNGRFLDEDGNETDDITRARFFKDEIGNKTKDVKEAKFEETNIFDEAFSLYSERLRQERVRMNIVEEMTRHAIGHEYSDEELAEFARWTGVSFSGMNKKERASFKQQVEGLREYFVGAMEAKIAETNEHNKGSGFDKLNVDDVWGRKEIQKTLSGKEIKFIRLTQEIIKDWHQQETLHGAVGGKRRERREAMRDMIGKRLGEMGLSVRTSAGEAATRVEIDELLNSGLLDSVEANAYYLTWMFQWTPYDSIRIYSRGPKSQLDDDFDDIVFHQETNVFFGRQVDHAWEFYHETNENRGRSKENEVNRIWKQYLPGKHHYLFPQNIAMVRWAYDFIMTDEQKAKVDRRTQELAAKYDFDNDVYHDEFVAWMRNVAVMDMIENGQFSFGQKRFSEIAKSGVIKKYEMIDIFADRLKNKVYSDPDNFQSYLANPTMERFMSLNSRKNFYSTRPARQFPWMTLAMRAHWEIINKHSKRLFDRKDVQSEVMEDVVTRLVTSGFLQKEQSVDFKRKNLGFLRISPHGNQDELPATPGVAYTVPAILLGGWARKVRQFLENSRRFTWEARFAPLFFIGALIVEILKRMPGQATGQSRS